MGSPLVVEPPQEVAGAGSPAPSRRPPRLWVIAAIVAVVVLAVAVFALTRGPDTAPITASDVNKAVQNGIAKAQDEAAKAPPDAAAAYRVALPSLVTVTTQRTDSNGAERGTGAGVVVSAEGTVLTALHVVQGAKSIEVTFSDGTASEATVEDQDLATDIAVLTPTQLPQVVVPAVLGGGAQVGEAVFALGHPLGLNGSLSAGVVSALGRTVQVSSDRTLKDLIQFDAAVNPGNSGGPLLNKAGQVVGIVTGLANPSEQNFFVGIGFAVPIATAGGIAGSPPQ
ncbi:S1C family serine protease [Pedococcus bigeumensis]|uniref:S1C family serine protease n=1 Tax=Pedococcus bigeumensis TaxID=433644 RepID=UPI001F4F639D|nr:trypsin-like peptidase domain-containing protein [Pedococcus bigeumensis]